MSALRGPVRRKRGGYVIDLGENEVAAVTSLVGQLRALITEDADEPGARALLDRLFPVAYPDDDEMEAEYQRLMREELVQSKLAAFDIIDAALADRALIDEGRLVAVMQSINSIRLVLGNILDVSDDPDIDEVAGGQEDSPEYALYSYLSWLLECCVRALE